MVVRVPHLSKSSIERDAEALIAEYEQARGVQIALPIPIEDIVEVYLKVTLEFGDTHKMFGVTRPYQNDTDILGAIFFDDRRIVIDETLDPDENPYREGRFRFTLAHEGGHWRLHRPFFERSRAQASLFDRGTAPAVICRSSEAKEPIEWQADYYASCLLMPRSMILKTWTKFTGSHRPRAIDGNNRVALFSDIDVDQVPVNVQYTSNPSVEASPGTIRLGLEDTARAHRVIKANTVDRALEEFCRPMAESFRVSPIAMRIRLEELGLLLRTFPEQCSLTHF